MANGYTLAANFEHRDITPEKRPERAGPKTIERVKTYLFFDLMKEALTNYDDARKGKLDLPKSEIHDIGFFFKKAWDNFTEPIVEYDEMIKAIEEKEWPSKGAKSRAFTALKERRAKSIEGLKEILGDPELGSAPELIDQAKLRKTLARIYEGYAAYIEGEKDGFEKLAEEVGKGFNSDLRSALGVWGPRPRSTEERG